MSKRYQLSMKSYDRLFPNQDTLPKGGFGNLIALPFQKDAVSRGNSVFIDDNNAPYLNQWEFLSSVKKMALSDIERILKDTVAGEKILGVRTSPTDENDPPWMKLPSGKRRFKPVIKDLPSSIELIIADKIYIKVDNLPSVLLNQVKRLAAFQNPEFYKRQNMRLSTAITPRVICCSEILDGYLTLPRGCLDDVSYLLKEYGIDVAIRDKRTSGVKTNFKFFGALNKEQKSAVRKILKKDMGVFVAPPGTGKTVTSIYAIVKRKTNTLVLTHRKPLIEQWRMRLASFLGIDVKDIGQIGGGKNNPNGMLDVAMIQSMERKGAVDDRIADYGFIIVDECHHISAVSFERVLAQAKAKYILGLTATPYRRDGHQPIIHMQCGPISCRIKTKDADYEIAGFTVIARNTKFVHDLSGQANIYDIWPRLINDEARNTIIINDIVSAVNDGRFPIILTERREHLEFLANALKNKIEHLAVLYGGVKAKERKEILHELSDISPDSKKAILATGSYIGEGFDDPRLDTLFMTMPISFKGKIVQYAGRLHRNHPGKKNVLIYDYVDKEVPMLWNMYQKRLKTYKNIGYVVKEGAS
jgi:superfamily II DNA or RNA helicase